MLALKTSNRVYSIKSIWCTPANEVTLVKEGRDSAADEAISLVTYLKSRFDTTLVLFTEAII